MSTPRSAAAAVTDPLQDPVWLIFIYSGWAACTWYVDAWLGLVVLVAATAVFTVAALLHPAGQAAPGPDGEPTAPFVADFNVVLLFCAASIAAAVLLLQALDRAPQLVLAAAAYAGAIGFAADHVAHRRGAGRGDPSRPNTGAGAKHAH